MDVEGYVSVATNRYSVPEEMIGRHVEVRQSKNFIEIYEGPRSIAIHPRVVEPTGRHFTLPEHRHPRGRGVKLPETLPEEKILVEKLPELASYVRALKEHIFGRGTSPLRRLLVMVNDYPREPPQKALKDYRRLAVPASRAGFLGFARPRKAERTSANRSVR